MFNEIFASSAPVVNLSDVDGYQGGEFFAAAELEANQSSAALEVYAALDNVDLILSNVSAEGREAAGNVALALMDGLSGGAASQHFGFSLESMSGDRFEEAQMGIGAMASNAWAAVIKFIKDMIRRVKVFLATFFDKMPGLKKRAEKIKERAEKTSGTAENTKISIGGYEVLAKKDKTVTGLDKSIESITNIEKTSGLAGFSSIVKEAGLDKLDSSPSELEKLKANNSGTGISVAEAGGSKALTEAAKKASNLNMGTTIIGLPGNKMFVFGRKSDSTSNTNSYISKMKVIASVRARFYTEDSSVKFDKSTEVKTLDTSEVEKICDVVVKFAETFEKSKSAVQNGYKEQEKLLKIAEKCEKNAGKSDYKDVKDVLNAGKSAIQNMATFAVNPMQQVSAYGYSVCSAALSYCEKSLSQYKD